MGNYRLVVYGKRAKEAGYCSVTGPGVREYGRAGEANAKRPHSYKVRAFKY